MDICRLMLDVVSEFYEKDSRVRTFGTDTELYHSEIHMLSCIAENPDLHISGLARVLKVTRGAASQTAKRLERKGMIVKESSSESTKKVILRLTAKGKVAVDHHKKAHEQVQALIAQSLQGASFEQLKFLSEFFLTLESKLKEQP